MTSGRSSSCGGTRPEGNAGSLSESDRSVSLSPSSPWVLRRFTSGFGECLARRSGLESHRRWQGKAAVRRPPLCFCSLWPRRWATCWTFCPVLSSAGGHEGRDFDSEVPWALQEGKVHFTILSSKLGTMIWTLHIQKQPVSPVLWHVAPGWRGVRLVLSSLLQLLQLQRDTITPAHIFYSHYNCHYRLFSSYCIIWQY